jgi:hypothetical protein
MSVRRENNNYMKRWAWVVAGLYGLILVALTFPVTAAAFFSTKTDGGQVKMSEIAQIFQTGQYWLWVAVMVLGQAALLRVPVRVASRRPIAHRSLWLTVGAAGLMMGALAVGAISSIYEFIFREKGPGDWLGWGALGGGIVVWFVWTVLFFLASRTEEPADMVSRQCRLLLKGSILELLIAVPTHIVARSRDYCCAGFMTFLGLTMGISVMLFSFGPAVFFLYADRWRRLHPQASDE